MPGRMLPDDTTLDRYYRDGLGPSEIVLRLAEDHDIHVTPEAISMWRGRRHGDTNTRRKYQELLPWEVRRAHKDLYPAKMLRLEGRRRAGEELPPHLVEALDGWIRKLKDNRAVVYYEPDVAPYWFYVPAEPGEDLIHPPDAEA